MHSHIAVWWADYVCVLELDRNPHIVGILRIGTTKQSALDTRHAGLLATYNVRLAGVVAVNLRIGDDLANVTWDSHTRHLSHTPA